MGLGSQRSPEGLGHHCPEREDGAWPRAPGRGLGAAVPGSGLSPGVLRDVAARASLAAARAGLACTPTCTPSALPLAQPGSGGELRCARMLARKEQLCLQQQGQQGIFTGCAACPQGQATSPLKWARGGLTPTGRARSGWQGARTQKAPVNAREGWSLRALGAWGCPGHVPIRWDLELATDSSEPSLPSVWQGESKPRD